MADAEESRREAITRCTCLAGKDACRYVAIWITVSRVIVKQKLWSPCMEPLAEHIIAVGTGVENPVYLWAPGQRP